jgi:hypothetical protein
VNLFDQSDRASRRTATAATPPASYRMDLTPSWPADENPVGTRRLVERYQALGLMRIETHDDTGTRHGPPNETDRGEVRREVPQWLGKTT